jgi:hypothetical protein
MEVDGGSRLRSYLRPLFGAVLRAMMGAAHGKPIRESGLIGPPWLSACSRVGSTEAIIVFGSRAVMEVVVFFL